MLSANQLVHDRYTLFRAYQGQRLHFESADYREIFSPWPMVEQDTFRRERIAVVGFMSEEQAFENLESLQDTFRKRHQPLTHERVAILYRAAALLKGRASAFADLIAWEGGKPLKDSRIEVERAIQSLEFAAAEASRQSGREIPMRGSATATGHIAFSYPEPIGVVLAISAFNHPLNLVVHQVAPALAVGCPVLVKPAEETPLSCLHFLDCLYEAGLPPEMCLPLVCDVKVAEAVAKSNKIGFLTFIGSAKVGWHLKSILAPGVRFALEHGGSAPVIVDRGSNLDEAVTCLLRGAFYHSGQVCVSVQRIFVHEEVSRDFQERFVAGMRKLKVGDPRAAETDCGPLIRERDVARVAARVLQARDAGAEILAGGKQLNKFVYEPTLIRDASRVGANEILREEIFGPVVCLETFREIEDAIDSANDVEWKFQAAYFGSEMSRALAAARGLRASAVMINESTTFRVDWMPFRGDGPSGFGTGGIPFSMHDMISEKMIVFKSDSFRL